MTRTFDTLSNNIIYISYPAGAFGNFLYYILTEFAEETVKVPNSQFTFSQRGNSHASVKYTNNYTHNPEVYEPLLLEDVDVTGKRILVLGDTGYKFPNYSENVNKVFPNATIVRTQINHEVRHTIFNTGSIKLGGKSVFAASDEDIKDFVKNHWERGDQDYSLREYYTILYSQFDSTEYSAEWGPRQLLKNNLDIWKHPDNQSNVINFQLKLLIEDPYVALCNLIKDLGMTVRNQERLKDTCNQWLDAHTVYFLPYLSWRRIEQSFNNNDVDISDITDIAVQGYINYCIEQKFNVTIPVYDYRDWFTNTKQIKEMLECLK